MCTTRGLLAAALAIGVLSGCGGANGTTHDNDELLSKC